MKRIHFVAGLLCLAVSGIASAHSNGHRIIAPGAALVPRYDAPNINDDRAFWRIVGSTPGWAKVLGNGFNSDFRYARLSVPNDSEFADGDLAFNLRANGGNSNVAQVCYGVYSISNLGTISAFAGSACTSGAVATDQNLARNLPVSFDSAVVVEMAAQNNGTIKYLRVSYD